MTTTVYNAGLDAISTWTTDDFGFLLVDSSYVPDVDDVYVSEVLAAELAGVGYGRQPVTGPTRTVDNTLDRIVYNCDDLDFGDIVTGEVADAMILYKFVTNDADSLLVAHYSLGGIATTGTAFFVAIGTAGAIFLRQG